MHPSEDAPAEPTLRVREEDEGGEEVGEEAEGKPRECWEGRRHAESREAGRKEAQRWGKPLVSVLVVGSEPVHDSLHVTYRLLAPGTEPRRVPQPIMVRYFKIRLYYGNYVPGALVCSLLFSLSRLGRSPLRRLPNSRSAIFFAIGEVAELSTRAP